MAIVLSPDARKQAFASLRRFCRDELEARVRPLLEPMSAVLPLCRVRAPELFSGSYDREMYVRLLEEAASTVWRGIGIRPGGDACPVPTLERWIGCG